MQGTKITPQQTEKSMNFEENSYYVFIYQVRNSKYSMHLHPDLQIVKDKNATSLLQEYFAYETITLSYI